MGVMVAHFGGWGVLPSRALPLNRLESRGDLSFPNLLLPHVLTQFVVHVGVDPAAKAIFLEQCSKNRGYRDADIRGFRPECGVCLPDGPEVIVSEVSMKEVSRRAAVQGVEVAFSRDAGRCVLLLGVGEAEGLMWPLTKLPPRMCHPAGCWELPRVIMQTLTLFTSAQD